MLRDGSTVHVRPVRPDDAESIRAFLETLSPESIAFRFFGMPNLDWVTSWSVHVDYADRVALVAEIGRPATIIAHAAYVRVDAARAEVAFMVADAWQGQGISTILLAHLAAVADRHGIAAFIAEVLPLNHRMIEVFRESGFPVEMRSPPTRSWSSCRPRCPPRRSGASRTAHGLRRSQPCATSSALAHWR